MKVVAFLAALALLALGAGLALHGPRRGLSLLRAWAWRVRVELALGGGALALVLFAARSDVRADLRALRAVLGALVFAGLWLVALRADPALRPIGARLRRLPVAAVGLLAAAAAWIAHHAVLGAVPHVSDEVAYLFQAAAHAQGALGFPPPPDWEAFGFIHTRVEDGLWHGIMSPGWPLLLAPGVALGAAGLVNPLLAALSVWLLYRALREGGASEDTARLAAFALAISPFFVFLAASFMAHTASLALFLAFVVAWQRTLAGGGFGAAAAAGLALALGILVRPLDAAVVALPFGAVLAARALRDARPRAPVAAMTAIAAVGVAATLAYNAALTGDPLVFAQTRYFEEATPGQRFGLGFGDDMGTRIHGPEWPGYHPEDVPRVTGHRLAVFLEDVHGLALLTAAALAGALRRGAAAPGLRLLLVAAGLLVAAYAAHFYHGVAYGARHYLLALPAAVVATAWLLAEGLARGGETARATRGALAAGAVTVLLVAYPPLVADYGSRYRRASPALLHAVRGADLHDALVLVDPAHWAWKSAFPLNRHPLERSDVVFAKDPGPGREDATRALVDRFPGRRVWRARVSADDRVWLEPASGANETNGAGPAARGPDPEDG